MSKYYTLSIETNGINLDSLNSCDFDTECDTWTAYNNEDWSNYAPMSVNFDALEDETFIIRANTKARNIACNEVLSYAARNGVTSTTAILREGVSGKKLGAYVKEGNAWSFYNA
jgi:hypothetical protein